MALSRTAVWLSLSTAICGSGFWLMKAQDEPQYLVDHSDCAYFGSDHEKFARTGLKEKQLAKPEELYRRSITTSAVTRSLGSQDTLPRDAATPQPVSGNTIDKYLFAAMQAAGVTPAANTTDAEFLRRVTLDLTGKIPTPSRVVSFLNDPTPNKRANLIEELMSRYEWIDKWTMFFGDLFQNASNTTQINRYPEGRDAFNTWIKTSLANNKPYDQIAQELISAKGTNSFTQGELNWVVGGRVTGGPNQDTWDQQATNVATTFLGLANVNCLLCHNGRGHLDTLNLWASQTTRSTAWQLSAFFSQGYLTQYKPAEKTQNGWWMWGPNKAQAPGVYNLGSTTGNRPPRTPPVPTTKSVVPVYFFNGAAPKSGEDYQAFLATAVTSDIQFARATVNYIWQQFFTRGLVEPANQFDLARLDPDNPPPAPWTLQPSNPRLLNALAQDFVNSKFDLKALMREITNSQAYQLSSRYDPAAWDVAWEPLFARKLVRRLWGEEAHDAVAQSSNMIPTPYKITDFGTTSWAMQFPEPKNIPGGSVGYFLDTFERGNRDDQTRRGDGSILQALSLLNDNFIVSRIKPNSSSATPNLMAQSMGMTDDQLIQNLYLSVLSRYPTQDEKNTAITQLGSGNRLQQAEDLLWSLYNKVDFIYNY
jgi:hypothetical protein